MDESGALSRIESCALSHPAVGDCAVLRRTTPAGTSELVAYVVPAAPFVAAELRAAIEAAAPGGPVPDMFVPVSCLPLCPDGSVDRVRLSSLEVVDRDLAARWEARVAEAPGIARTACLIQANTPRGLPLHLSDLLPGWIGADGAAERRSAADRCRADEPQGVALADGGPLHEAPDAPVLLADLLCRAAGSGEGLRYIEADGSERSQSYRELKEGAERILAGLRAHHVHPGAPVVLQLERHQDFMEAFWACVLGGAVPVPLAVPPSYESAAGPLQTLQASWDLLDRPLVITARHLQPRLETAAGRLGLEGLRVRAVEDLRQEPDTRYHRGTRDDLALLMLTSGSTGTPKAVQLSHRNLLTRTAASRQLNGFSEREITLNWMPLDHVAGLIYFHIRDVALACRQVHVPTQRIVQDPLQWLGLLERYQATVTFAPNFAFALVNDREAEIARRSWDLSSVRVVLNGAEAIVARTARKFLRLLEPHGLSSAAMRPAWGMSETSSGVVYGDTFSLATSSDDDPFVEVGRPIPSLSMRIVDAGDRVVGEGVVGRLQVRGPAVTAGYYRREDLNRETFTADGWFNTGDLGTIRKGRLTITGREKDVVIVNSVNYYCHAIESAVEQLDGVVPSFTAACAVRRPGADTDGLGVFFCARVADGPALGELCALVRAQIRTKVGIGPDYLIPVEPSEVPKTTLGKIQRADLARRLVAGEFDDILKHVDRLTASPNTIPDWFYRKVWQRRNAVPGDAPPGSAALVFMEGDDAGAAVCAALERRGLQCIVVEPGDGFHRIARGLFRIDPAVEADYLRLAVTLAAEGVFPDQVVHLWGYGPYVGELTGDEIAQAQAGGALSAIALTKALGSTFGSARPIRATFVASHAQRVRPDDLVAYEKAPLVALAKSIPQEAPWLQCRHVDLHEPDPDRAASLVVAEMCVPHGEREVAYRDGLRFVSRLEKVAFQAGAQRGLPFRRGGMYLVTGGAGGIGECVSKYLREHFDACLLLVGRSARAGHIASVLHQFRGGSVAYEAADVTDEPRLSAVVEKYESLWGRRLDGVIHLAGVYHEGLVADETPDRFQALLKPKALGTESLHRLLESRGGGLFVASSSLAGFFGGASIGTYAAASRFQDAFAEHHRDHRTIRHYCFDWSNWDGIGQSRDYQTKDLPRSHGYQPMASEHALRSLLVGLTFGEQALIVGLDEGHRHIRRYLAGDVAPLEKAVVCYATVNGPVEPRLLDGLQVADRFGTASRPEFVRVPRMPVTGNAEVDREQLALLVTGEGRQRGTRPRDDMERRIGDIWKQLLALPDVSVEDNFFELGGDSLLAVRLLDQIRQRIGVELTVRTIFDAATLADLAAVVSRSVPSQPAPAPAAEPVLDVAAAQSLLARVGALSDSEVDTLLRELGTDVVEE